MLEADIMQYYPGQDLRELWGPDPKCTARHYANLAANLPDESRCRRWIDNSPLTPEQRMLWDLVDIMAMTHHQSCITAASWAGDKYESISKKGPQPQEKPTYRDVPKPKRKFSSVADLRSIFSK